MNRRLAVPLALLATGLAAPSAHATTFCVPAFHAACPDNGTNVAQTNLETAMGTLGGDGVADTVIAAPGVYTDLVTFEPAGSDALVVQGAGIGQSTLTTASTGNVFVVNLNMGARAVTLRDLTIRMPASLPDNSGAGIQTRDGTLVERVAFDSQNPGAFGTTAIASVLGALTLKDVQAGASNGGALDSGLRASASATSVTIDGLRVTAPTATALQFNGVPTATAANVTVLDAKQPAVSVSQGAVTVGNLVATTASASTLSVFANTSNPASLTVDHATLAKAGGVAGSPFYVAATSTGNASMTVRSSIATGYTSAYLRSGKVGGGSASIGISHSDVPQAGALENGPGAALLTNVITADPLFVAAPGDLRLAAGSPAIDTGDPAGAGPATDLDGAARVTDGNGDGTARRDMGAYELPAPAPTVVAEPVVSPPVADPAPSAPLVPVSPVTPVTPVTPPKDTTAPNTRITSGPGKRLARREARFTFTATEKGSRLQCSLDGRRFTACRSGKRYRLLKRGRHVVRVRAIDAAGNVDRTPAVRRFSVPRARTGG